MKKPIIPITLASLLTAGTAFSADTPPAGFGKPDRVFVIKTMAGQMKYDQADLMVRPGQKVRINLKNEDQLPHNLVVLKEKGIYLKVAEKAWALGTEGPAKNWIPEDDRVIAGTKMADPGQTTSVWFTAPAQEGDVDFVCTFPGHAMVMNGKLHVSNAPEPGLDNLTYIAYKGGWSKLPDFSTLEKAGTATDELNDNLIDIHAAKLTNGFGMVFDGRLNVPVDGDYTFNLGSDDGSRVWIDDKVIVEVDGIHPHTEKSGKVKLAKGPHVFKAAYFDGGGQTSMTLAWSGPGFKDKNLSKEKREKNRGEQFEEILLAPTATEAVIYRGFMDKAEGSHRMIAVGWPGGLNAAFDQDQLRLGLLWKGKFFDAGRHWIGRGAGNQGPEGYAVQPLTLGENFAVLADAAAPWPAPKDGRATASTFRGYALDKNGYPTFTYTTGGASGVQVTDRPEPAGALDKGTEAIKRTLTLKAAQAPGLLYFRATGGHPVTAQPDGSYKVDGGLTLRIESAERPVIRGQELLVPVKFENGTATLTVTYTWQ